MSLMRAGRVVRGCRVYSTLVALPTYVAIELSFVLSTPCKDRCGQPTAPSKAKDAVRFSSAQILQAEMSRRARACRRSPCSDASCTRCG